MGHIFISYSHKDTEYAHALADHLQKSGIEVWIDERLDYGSQWPHELQYRLDTCSALILVMSPRSYESEWVQSELQRARRKSKPIFPLLLEGDEPWLSVESTQYFDVRGQQLPDAKFYAAVRAVLASAKGKAVQPAPGALKPLESGSRERVARSRTGMIIAALGGVAIVLVIVFIAARSASPGEPEPPPTGKATLVPSPAVSGVTRRPTTAPIPASPDGSGDPADFLDAKGVPMRLVPAGNFIMGSDSGYPEEKPVHTVYLDDFYIDRYEVTNASYKACVQVGVCQPPTRTSSSTRENYFGNSQFDDYPVVFVSWDEADMYCKWRDMSLPTEAQWEKAARGTDGRSYPWGEGIDATQANYNDSVGDTTAVGGYESGKSVYGVYDLAGNAWEWVADWYSSTYYLDTPLMDPRGPASGEYRVLRGGSWHDEEQILRTSNRGWSQLEYFYNPDFGFRCAMDGQP